MDYEELEADRNKILLGLVKFYYESGYKSSAYMDPETGGIYEHKLANILGYRLIQDDQPPPEFVAATKLLEEQGCVRRMRRNPNVAMMGVWPTSKGLEEIEKLRAPYAPRVSDNSSLQKVGRTKKVWSDPVLSKVIANGIWVIPSTLFYFAGWWPTIVQWFFSESKIPNWFLFVLCSISILYIVKIVYRIARFK
jgi:hypothetical protein